MQDLWTEAFQLYHKDTITVGLTESQTIVLTTTGLRASLIGDLTLSAEVQFDWNDSPADGTQKTDERYFLKLGYQFRGDETDWWQ